MGTRRWRTSSISESTSCNPASIATASWSEPSSLPPTGNVGVPLHRGVDQVKDGDLGVQGFIAQQSASFLQDTFFTGTLHGGNPGDTTSTVFFGGKDAGGTLHTVDVANVGNIEAVKTVTVGDVANTGNAHLCAATDGTITFCDSGAVVGNSDCPTGQTHVWPNGNCGPSVVIENIKSSEGGNVAPQATISAVSGISGYTFSGPVNYQKPIDTGVHGIFNGGISVTVTSPYTPPLVQYKAGTDNEYGYGPHGTLSLYVNGYITSCYIIDNTNKKVFTFPSLNYDSKVHLINIKVGLDGSEDQYGNVTWNNGMVCK